MILKNITVNEQINQNFQIATACKTDKIKKLFSKYLLVNNENSFFMGITFMQSVWLSSASLALYGQTMYQCFDKSTYKILLFNFCLVSSIPLSDGYTCLCVIEKWLPVNRIACHLEVSVLKLLIELIFYSKLVEQPDSLILAWNPGIQEVDAVEPGDQCHFSSFSNPEQNNPTSNHPFWDYLNLTLHLSFQNWKISKNLHLIPLQILLCSYRCFDRRGPNLFGIAQEQSM